MAETMETTADTGATTASVDTQASAPNEAGDSLLTQEAQTSSQEGVTESTAQEQEPAQEQDPANLIPEVYELANKDGTPLDPSEAADFQDIFKNAGLTAKQAQAMYDAYNLKSSDLAEQFKQAIAQKQKSDMNTVKQDPELGGANFENTRMYIGTAMQKFGTPELRQKLVENGLDNDPDFVRFVAKVGKAFSNDEFIGGRSASAKTEDPIAKAKRLYPKSPELWRV